MKILLICLALTAALLAAPRNTSVNYAGGASSLLAGTNITIVNNTISAVPITIITNTIADQAIASTTTLADVTGLTVALEAGKLYTYEIHLPFSLAGITSGYKFALSTPTLTYGHLTHKVLNGVTAVLVTVGNNTTVTSSLNGALATIGTHVIEMRGTLSVSSSGIFKLQAAQNTSDAGALTILRGAYLIINRVN